MQLFTLGLNKLNADGTTVLDASGKVTPTYTQDDVMALGRSLTVGHTRSNRQDFPNAQP